MKNTLFIVILTGILASCTVSEEQINKANELCSAHDGVELLWGTVWLHSIDVICKDSTKIQSSLRNKSDKQ